MLNKHNQEGILGLFKSKIMLVISINLFFQWYLKKQEKFHFHFVNFVFF